jgi:hypothetical protein
VHVLVGLDNRYTLNTNPFSENCQKTIFRACSSPRP